MTPENRKALAEQILTNPLFPSVMDDLERAAMEIGVYADPMDDLKRGAAMAEVRAIRAFRRNLEAALQDTPKRKGAPA